MSLNKYSVIGIYPESGQIFCHHVEATSGTNAFMEAANHLPDTEMEMVVALPGHQLEGQLLTFPGDSLVSSETIMSQPEVFGPSSVETEPYETATLKAFEYLLMLRAGGGPSESNYDPDLLCSGMAMLELLRARLGGA